MAESARGRDGALARGTPGVAPEDENLFGRDSFPASDPPSTWWGGHQDLSPGPVPTQGVPPARPASTTPAGTRGSADPPPSEE